MVEKQAGKKRNNIPAHDSLMFSPLVKFYGSASPLSRKPVGLGSVGWKKGKGWRGEIMTATRVEVSIKLYLLRLIKKEKKRNQFNRF